MVPKNSYTVANDVSQINGTIGSLKLKALFFSNRTTKGTIPIKRAI